MNARQSLAAQQALHAIAEDAQSALDGEEDVKVVLQRVHFLSTKALEELPEVFAR